MACRAAYRGQTQAPTRLIASSEEILLADKYVCLITVCADETDRPWEVVLKMRAKAGKDGSDTATMAADLGIAISRMMQGRHAEPEHEPAKEKGEEGL